MRNLIRLNSSANNIYSDLRTKSGKVVEVVGLLLGFIVVAIVELQFENYACVSKYLKDGFTLALFFLLVSISLGLIVCLDTSALYSARKLTVGEVEISVKHLNKLRILLNFSILFCGFGLISVISVVTLLIFKSLDPVLGFVFFYGITLLIIVKWIAPYLESIITKEG